MKNQIRILHVIGIMNRGGAETMLMNLYRNIDRTKVQFDFVENTEKTGIFEKEISELGGRIFHCPHFNGKNLFEYRRWWDEFFSKHKNEYAFVHGHIGSTAAIYLSSAKKHGIKTIAHSHNTFVGFSFKQCLYRVMSFPTKYIANYFFGCSEEAAVSRYGRQSKIEVLNNAIDTQHFLYFGRKEYPFTEGKIVYGHIGRFNDQKNHKFLITIYSEIYKKQHNSILLLIGDGPLRKEIEEKVDQIGLNKNVLFLGIRENIPELLSSMDLLLFPSKYEGLPVTLVEAQTSGLRCLISDVISDESVLVPELITKISLKKSAAIWADKAIELSHYNRRSYCQEVSAAGFDIQKNAKWLQEFYIKEAGVK